MMPKSNASAASHRDELHAAEDRLPHTQSSTLRLLVGVAVVIVLALFRRQVLHHLLISSLWLQTTPAVVAVKGEGIK